MALDPTNALLAVTIYDPAGVEIFAGADTGDLVLIGSVTLGSSAPLSVAVYPSD